MTQMEIQSLRFTDSYFKEEIIKLNKKIEKTKNALKACNHSVVFEETLTKLNNYTLLHADLVIHRQGIRAILDRLVIDHSAGGF